MSTCIRNFYRKKNILITGGTGFLGLAILEKILRTFPDVGNVYLIAREKRNVSLENRISKLENNHVFHRVKKEHFENGTQVDFTRFRWVPGDLQYPNLGLSETSIKELQDDVNIIIHCAATVKFLEPLKTAIDINVKATQDLINLAAGCKNFEGFAYVSTSYCQARKSVKEVTETMMNHPIAPKDLINYSQTMTLNELNEKTLEIIDDWPNTYSFTKNAAENLFRNHQQLFPVCIYRPGIVVHAYRDPAPYWIGNNMAFARIMMEGHRGYVLKANPSANGNLVPVDLVVNGLFAAMQDTFAKRKLEIFNFTTSHNPCGFSKVFTSYVSAIENYESELIPLRQKLLGMLKMKENQAQFSKIEENMLVEIDGFERFLETAHYFLHMPFEFQNNHMNELWSAMSDENKSLCPFDLRHIDWDEFYRNAYRNAFGTRKIDFGELHHDLKTN